MSEFKDYRKEFAEYERDYPVREVKLSRGMFPYILAGPRESAHTLVFLNGGMNSYEMWMRYVKELSADYRVLSFDFPQMYPTNQELCGGMHELFQKLSIEKAVLVGASMGGIIAQIYARKYPEDVEALCLFSTAGLTEGALRKFGKPLKLLSVVIFLMKVLPYSWFIKGEKKMVAGYVKEADPESRAYFKDMFDHIYETYTREKDIHVERLMRDFGNQSLCTPDDFKYLAGRVLLLLPEDDSEFPQELQQELVHVMTDPTVIPHIRGGHLTTMTEYESYIGYIRKFLEKLPLAE